jgi:hypothetical protein
MKMGAFLLFGRTKQSDLHRTAFRWQLGVVSKITELARSTINRGKFIDARRKIARTIEQPVLAQFVGFPVPTSAGSIAPERRSFGLSLMPGRSAG